MSPIGARWLFAGSVVYVIDFVFFVLLYQFTNVVLIANLGSMLASGGFGFFLNQLFVYKITVNTPELAKYSLSVCVSIVLHSGVLIILVDNVSTPVQFAKVLTSLILVPISFLLSNALFKKKVRLWK